MDHIETGLGSQVLKSDLVLFHLLDRHWRRRRMLDAAGKAAAAVIGAAIGGLIAVTILLWSNTLFALS